MKDGGFALFLCVLLICLTVVQLAEMGWGLR